MSEPKTVRVASRGLKGISEVSRSFYASLILFFSKWILWILTQCLNQWTSVY